MVFEIESFYPLISEKLFKEAIQYARNILEIPEHDMIIIKHSRISLLFHDNKPLAKKEGSEDFDFTTGSNDGAEISELVGFLLLSKLVHLFQDNSIWLCPDDRLGLLKESPGPETKSLSKNVVKVFKNCGLSITGKTNLKIVVYLNVTFDLQSIRYNPFRKLDTLPVYIQKHSNHPSITLNRLPKSIVKIKSDFSSSKNIFQIAIPGYKEVFRKSDFTSDLDT